MVIWSISKVCAGSKGKNQQQKFNIMQLGKFFSHLVIEKMSKFLYMYIVRNIQSLYCWTVAPLLCDPKFSTQD